MRDAYRNPVQVDEYGNLVCGQHGTGGYGTTGHIAEQQPHQGVSSELHRSGGSSSSSSEDDGHGGRRKKKGLKEKVKENIPGMGHNGDESHATSTTTPAAAYGQGHDQQHGKKGIMEKIK